MSAYVMVIKDILIIIVPVVVAYLSYRSNKKTENDIRLELEKSLKEKDADTAQMLSKINAELESQKQISSWNNSLPKTDEYINQIGMLRHGNVAGLPDLIQKVFPYIKRNNLSIKELSDIRNMLLKIKLPIDEQEMYPYEIPIMIDFLKLLNTVEGKIHQLK